MNSAERKRQALLYLEHAHRSALQRRGAATADLIAVAQEHIRNIDSNNNTINRILEAIRRKTA